LCLLAVTGVLASPSMDKAEIFGDFVTKFGKTYASYKESEYRRSVFLTNYEKMEEHNKLYAEGKESYWMKVHPDMDLTIQEWEEKRLGGIPAMSADIKAKDTLNPEIMEKLAKQGPTPKEFEWVSAGKVSPVKNQAACGSCACFSAVASIESCFMIQAEDAAAGDLSEQHLLDCAYHHQVTDDMGTWEAFGCQGAWANVYVDFIQGNMNQEEAGYKYTSGDSGKVGECMPSDGNIHSQAMVTGFQNMWGADEATMESLLMIGPVATSVKATHNWSAYGGGVLIDHACCDSVDHDHCSWQTNHSVLVVGYGTEGGQDYWLIKNSWGSDWGEEGYIKLKKGTGHCGVAYSQQTIPTCSAA